MAPLSVLGSVVSSSDIVNPRNAKPNLLTLKDGANIFLGMVRCPLFCENHQRRGFLPLFPPLFRVFSRADFPLLLLFRSCQNEFGRSRDSGISSNDSMLRRIPPSSSWSCLTLSPPRPTRVAIMFCGA